ncbi:MAG: metallophosphoesterase family protein [Candidatus Kariarchaeaceae archaeon]
MKKLKIAIFGDIHGNIFGLQSVFNDMLFEKPDSVYCTGDLLLPLPGAEKVWKCVSENQIPLVRGNGEDRIISFLSKNPESPSKNKVQFRPMQIVMKTLNPNIKNDLKKLPLTRTIEGPDDTKVLICHGTPFNNNKYLINPNGIPERVNFEELCVNIIVAGHSHKYHQIKAADTLLITTGSAGLAFCGIPRVQYLILEYKNKRWNPYLKTLKYDFQSLIKEILAPNYFMQGAPISWLIFDEIVTHESRVYPFLTKYLPLFYPEAELEHELTHACTKYLKSIGRWNYLKKYCRKSQ